MSEACAICGCKLSRKAGTYAARTLEGRSSATRHHYIAERFFGRSKNRPNTEYAGIFTEEKCPWKAAGAVTLCCECHEELLHNPVFLPKDIEKFRKLVQSRRLSEANGKPGRSRELIAGRIKLLHEVIARGLEAMSKDVDGDLD